MTHTVTQTGLYAFDGVHVCHLTRGDALAEFDRLPLHYTPGQRIIVAADHLDALAADGWAAAEGAPAPAPHVDEPDAKAVEGTEIVSEGEKAQEPATENKAVDPVAETKPAAPLATKKPAPKKKR